MDTLCTMRGSLTRFIKDDEDTALLNDAINAAIDSLWLSCLLVHLGQFMGGPIFPASLQLAAGTERATIVSIPDPPQLTNAQWSTVPAPLGPTQPVMRSQMFCITYVTESGSETAPDYIGANHLTPPTILTVNPGAGLLSVIRPPSYPNIPFPAYSPAANPIGWNLYGSGPIAGDNTAPDISRLVLLNPVPMSFNQVWTEPVAGIPQAPAAGPTPPVSNTTADNIFYVRVLEVQNPDQTWTRWVAGSIDGLLFDRAVKAIAPQTTYQRYAYDFVNGNTLEIRPALGQGLDPRMFFVTKPRRLKYDNSPLPFTNIVYSEFITMHAAAYVNRSNHEYTAASQNENVAEARRTSILEGLNTQSTTKQKSITPYMARGI